MDGVNFFGIAFAVVNSQNFTSASLMVQDNVLGNNKIKLWWI